MRIVFTICLLLLVMVLSGAVFAKSGVQAIIEQNAQEEAAGAYIGEGTVYYEEPNITITGESDSWESMGPDTGSSSSFLRLDMNIDNMKQAISSSVGLPHANVYVLLLFSLAALIEMARVVSGGGGWIPFVMRVVIALAFLESFDLLFSGVEMFFGYVGDQILNGQSAATVLWDAQGVIIDKLQSEMASDGGMFSQIKAYLSREGVLFVVSLLSYVFSYALYILIYLVQACIIIAFKYLGPIIISLAIIPETNYTDGYIASTFQVLSWTIVSALLIRIMSTIPVIGISESMGVSDLIALTSMNICFALAFTTVPLIAGMVFSGRGIGGIGGAMTAMGASFMFSGAKQTAKLTAKTAGKVVGKTVSMARNKISSMRSSGSRSSSNHTATGGAAGSGTPAAVSAGKNGNERSALAARQRHDTAGGMA